MTPRRILDVRHRLDPSAIVAGGLMGLIGAFVIAQALGMQLGSPSRMGPGYYPLLLGIACVGLGLCIAIFEARGTEDRPDADRDPAAWKSRLLVPASMIAFALLLERAGLAPACIALVCVASPAAPRRTVAGTVALAVATPVLAWLIFVLGLGLPFTVVEGLL
ncbi:tripartite tricarboxylate transporter TctB family protein [Psychromarinibacter sp. C21-152]|uniref:Tripartite tricarboxylate transporter TctB family protein n=1 Tax=Psychromarinibacter sediminicola TaxID=3033385 RepID=A0AAE3NS73_9RHOB|nr:tripartite tricarboxylate transporter TctB family protein [Psychromarinibacter sediminicola]MDF0601107.1 tripartite tricarboxylate transporter TctB family protein [Psychromarinibacter sediminicola]